MKKEAIEARKDKVIVRNRKAYHLYMILEVYEAGIELKGTEVKSLRAGENTSMISAGASRFCPL